MTREERKETLRGLWQKSRMLFTLMRAVWSGQVITADVELRGSVLLNHGIEKFAMLHGLEIETEPAGDEQGPLAFLVIQMDGIEILQIDENYSPEDDAT